MPGKGGHGPLANSFISFRVFTSLWSCVSFWPLMLEGGGGGGVLQGEIDVAAGWEE